MSQVLDSCDASGEYTTGDSDRNSVTSEELSPSVATYCNVTSSQEHSINVATPTNHGTPKVIILKSVTEYLITITLITLILLKEILL